MSKEQLHQTVWAALGVLFSRTQLVRSHIDIFYPCDTGPRSTGSTRHNKRHDSARKTKLIPCQAS